MAKRKPAKTATPARPEPGAFRIEELGFGQCRFACTAFTASREEHRFCGQPTVSDKSSWCIEHLPRVTCAPGRGVGGASVADVAAGKAATEEAV